MQKRLPLQLSVKRSTWRLADGGARVHDERFAAVRASVLERDDHTCRFCGFRSAPNKNGASWQEVHHLDDNHANNARENLATACPLCHQCFHIGFAGMQQRGILIWLPEIDQVNLNDLVRTIGISIVLGSSYMESAKAIYAALESRQNTLESMFGQGASDPAMFGQALIDASAKARKHIAMPDGIRLLARPERFSQQFMHWANMYSESLTPSSWDRIYEQYVRKGLNS